MAKKPKAAPAGKPASGHGFVPLADSGTFSSPPLLQGAVVNNKGELVDLPPASRRAWLARWARRMDAWPKDASSSPRIAFQTADPAVCFARAARQRLNGELFRCEERLPLGARHRVIYVIVRRDPARWRRLLRSLGGEYFRTGGGRAPGVRIEIVDRRTEASVQRLVDAGVLARTIARARSLWPLETGAGFELTEDEWRAVRAHRAQAARRLKMAAVLARGDLLEEARAAALDAVEPLGRALAVENRLPEPACLEEALMPPLDKAWKTALPAVRELLRAEGRPVLPVIAALRRL